MSIAWQFRCAMERSGLPYDGSILADGKLHRFKARGDKTRNSWYVLHSGPVAAGCFGCWKRGGRETWRENLTRKLSDLEWRDVRDAWKRAHLERELAKRQRQAKPKMMAEWILARTTAARDHNYLAQKCVNPHGELRCRGDTLVLPLRDSAGTLHSLQFIAPDRRFDGERQPDIVERL